MNPVILRQIVQEAGFPVIAQALQDEKLETREGLLKRLPAGTREIIEQELEMSVDDKSAAADAKGKVVAIARQMMADGRLHFGEKK